MAGPDDRAERAKAKAEAQFKRDESAKGALAEAEQHARGERDKTARLRAQRLARDEAERAATASDRQASKPAKTVKRVRKGSSSA